MRNVPLSDLGLSAAFLALALTPGPAYAEQITLSCRVEYQSGTESTETLRIDDATGRLEWTGPNGKAIPNRTVTATVSPNAFVWSIDRPTSYRTGDGVTHQTTEHYEGHIDRLSGTGRAFVSERDNVVMLNVTLMCRKATAPKF